MRKSSAKKIKMNRPEAGTEADPIQVQMDQITLDCMSRVPKLMDSLETLVDAGVREATTLSSTDILNGAVPTTPEMVTLGQEKVVLMLRKQIRDLERDLSGENEKTCDIGDSVFPLTDDPPAADSYTGPSKY
jgi:hypothetical protein